MNTCKTAISGPVTYDTLDKFLADKEVKQIAPNTYAERKGFSEIVIRLYSTVILTYYPTGFVKVTTGGYRSVTTKARINLFLPESYALSQVNKVWRWPSGKEFMEGELVRPFTRGGE